MLIIGQLSFVLLLAACSTPQPTSTPQNALAFTPTPAMRESPSDGQVIANLAAFARLYGYVRYFHPSDEAADLDWDQFAINGVQEIKDAVNTSDLVERLEALFQHCAPTVRVFHVAERPSIPSELFPPEDATELHVVMWRHYGVEGEVPESIYHSERISESAPKGEIPDGFHDPREPFYAELGSDVAALIPLTLFADNGGTLPHFSLSEQDLPDRVKPYDEPATRLAGVVIAWNVFQHFYPYFDVVDTDWSQVLEEALVGALEASDDAAYYKVLQRLVAQLHDGHGSVYPSSVSYCSPQLRLVWAEEHLIVLHAAGKAAESLGPGDIILSVDGQSAAEAITEVEELISGATPQWKRYVALLMMGHCGSQVTLEAQTKSGEQITVSLTRTVRYGTGTFEQPRPAKIEELEPGIFYIDLGRVDDDDFKAALPQLETASGIVFDLRGYPKVSPDPIGHLIDEPVTSAQWHVPIVTYPDRQNVTFDFRNWEVEPRAPHLKAKIVFLTDGQAISYAETYMGIIEHYQLAEIVGEPTAGTNGNINQFAIPGGYWFSWTGMKVLKHDGSQHHGVGIQPTVFVSRTIQGVAEGRDEQLERAIEIVRQSP